MSNRSETFGRLLKGAINSIAAYEGKTAPAIEDELGEQIGVAGSTIQRYKAGYLPTEPRVVQILAEAAVRRGYLSRAWLQRFLQAARYPSPDTLVTQLADVFGQSAPSGDERGLPGGTLTFLFTDIEGSTTRWERQPEAMERALARHDQLLRQAIDAYGGHVVKTVGDAFQAVFTTAPAALEAALAAQRALAAEGWGPIEPIRARMALHVGMVQQRDGDYFGQPLNRVARLCTAGHGGQVLLSNAAQELVRDVLPKGTELRDLGEHRLKDLARPERIYQVVAPDLPADFPSLRTLDRYTHNLPAQATPLIGREREVQAVCALVRRGTVRLLTLTGPGGTGKTRLALQTAADLLDDFRDGVSFVPLAPIHDPELVPVAIAQALGVKEQGDRSLLEQLKAYLHQKRLLLLLDNFEQVAAAGSLVAELLAAAPALKVMVTSREVLHLYGEHEYSVPPLSLPDMRNLPPIERLTQYEAVRLFIERAQAVRPDFTVTAENAPAVAEICTRLDGLPLAIELAAARSKLFPPKALLLRLDKRLALLTTGARDLPARQQTLHNAIAWSYHLLDAAEQAIFARLGVFVGGCTLEAAEAVLADDHAGEETELTISIPTTAVLDCLTSLVDKSLLKREDVKGESRFLMLETIREYALEQLEASGEMAALQNRHAECYLALVETAAPELQAAQQKLWLERLETEIDNIRAALVWSLREQGNVDIGLRMSGTLYWFWLGSGYFSEGRAWLDKTLERAGTGAPLLVRARALLAAGDITCLQGDDQQSATLLDQALALYQSAGDQAGIAEAQYLLGWTTHRQGDDTRAVVLLNASLALARTIGNSYVMTWALLYLSELEIARGNLEPVAGYLAEADAIASTAGNQFNLVHVAYRHGVVAYLQGDYDQAQASLERALILAREVERGVLPYILMDLGKVAHTKGQVPHAIALLRESLSGLRDRNLPGGMLYALEALAGALAAEGEAEHAARFLGGADALREALDLQRHLPWGPDYERDVAVARAQLDDASFAEAWAAGCALSLEQAVAEALAISDASEQQQFD